MQVLCVSFVRNGNTILALAFLSQCLASQLSPLGLIGSSGTWSVKMGSMVGISLRGSPAILAQADQQIFLCCLSLSPSLRSPAQFRLALPRTVGLGSRPQGHSKYQSFCGSSGGYCWYSPISGAFSAAGVRSLHLPQGRLRLVLQGRVLHLWVLTPLRARGAEPLLRDHGSRPSEGR